MKKIILSVLAFVFVLSGCGGSSDEPTKGEVNLLVMSRSSGELLSSQLNNAGFETKTTTVPDYSSFISEVEKGNYDITLTGWTTVTGNPDYAVMSLFSSGGDYNTNGLSDYELDGYLTKGRESEVGSEEFIDAYYNVEKILNEKAYIVPLNYNLRTYSISDSVDESTVDVYKSRSFKLENYSFKDKEKNETAPFRIGHSTVSLTSLDPMKANDGTVFAINTNQYARLVNLGSKDQIEPGLAVAYDTNDQENYYFAIRNDAKFSNGKKISTEDIIYSLERASNPEIKGNRVYSIQGIIDSIEKVEADAVPTEVMDNLKKQADTRDLELICIKTKTGYGQLYNMLAHTSGGIVSKEAVEEAGDDYGDISKLENLAVSGPYQVTSIDETTNKIILTRNENYYEPAKIKTVIFKVIPEISTQVNAIQAGELELVYNIPVFQYSVIEKAKNTELLKVDSNGFSYIQFNMKDGSRAIDENFRKAIYFAVDPNSFLQIIQSGEGGIGASPLYPVIKDNYPTNYERPASSQEKSDEFYNLYKGE